VVVSDTSFLVVNFEHWYFAFSLTADHAHSALPSAFADAQACNRCIMLEAGSSVTTVSMHGGGQMLEVKDAMKHHVSITIPNGGSVSQLDMWKLMINKVCTSFNANRLRLSWRPCSRILPSERYFA
jgi:hypothetical protein